MNHKWYVREASNRLTFYVESNFCTVCKTEKFILSIGDNPLFLLYKAFGENDWKVVQGSVLDCPWECKDV
jgi:hypothetical protein